MFNEMIKDMLIQGTKDTLYMTLVSTFFGYVAGLPIGILLTVSDKNGIAPCPVVYRILDFIVNIIRSIPFLILLILVIPLTKLVVGQSYGTKGTLVPLTIAAAPFIGRMVESSIKELDQGIIEAALSMGASPFQIIWKVMLPETKPSLWVGAAISATTILGYSAMAGLPVVVA